MPCDDQYNNLSHYGIISYEEVPHYSQPYNQILHEISNKKHELIGRIHHAYLKR